MISYYSVAPYFAITFLCYVLAKWLVPLMPSAYWKESGTQKHQTIEGARSLLALGVFFHHAVITYQSYVTNAWALPPSKFYANLGPFCVAIFFMITGFLFWEKAILSNGVIQYKALVKSRIKRIAPVYIATASIVLCIIFLQSTTAQHSFTAKDIFPALSLLFGMGLASRKPINDIDPDTLYAGVLWTLKAEWHFYIFLPLLACLLRRHVPRYVLIAVIVACLVYVVGYRFNKSSIIYLFMCGMFSAALAHNKKIHAALTNNSYLTFLGIFSLIAILGFVERVYDYYAVTLAFVVFLMLLYLPSQSYMRRLLLTPAAKVLGAISYSTYLLHGIVLYVSFGLMNGYFPIKEMSSIQIWMLIALNAALVVLLSVLSFKFIEYPFMRRAAPVSATGVHGGGVVKF